MANDLPVVSARELDVVSAWAAVMADVQAVAKGDKNTSQGYSFRGIDAVMNAVGPALRTHGVVILPTETEASYRDVTVGKNNTPQRECTVKVVYTIFGPNGGTLKGEARAEALDSGDKATSKAMSVAYRTFLLQGLTIPTHEPDPDQTTVQRSVPGFGKAAAKRLLVELVGKDEAAQAWEWGSADDLSDYSEAIVEDLAKRWQERPMEATE